MTSPHRPGDLVRVVIESEVHRVDDDGYLSVGNPGFGNLIHPGAAHVKSVEVLAPPEKQWVDGDVVRDASGWFYVRSGDGWQTGGVLAVHDYPKRPLTELVPKETT